MKHALRKKVFFGIWGAVSALQILLVGAMVFLSQLTHKRGGVNHHVAYRKRQYNELIFNDQNVLIMQILLIFAFILLAVLLIRALNNKNFERSILLTVSLAMCGVLMFEISSVLFREIPIFPYAVFTSVGIFGLQILLILIQRFIQKES